MGLFGIEWLYEAWKYIQETKIEHYRILKGLMPLARTPMDRRGAASLKDYSKSIDRQFDRAIPWQSGSSKLEHLRDKVKPGEVVVVLESGESPDNPLYKGVKTVRE